MKCDIKETLRSGLILLATALVVCYCIGMPALADTQYSDITGAVTGRVTTPDGNGVGGAYVAIVSAYDPSVEIFNTTSDAYGNYQIVGIKNTMLPNGTIDKAYMIYAIKNPYGAGYSVPFGIDPNNNAATVTSVVLSPASPSTGRVGIPTVWSQAGSVTGRATTSVNGTVGVGGAYIALIDATTGKEYYNTTSDAYGNYQITGINATYSSVLQAGPDGTADTYYAGTHAYSIYANKSSYGQGWSMPFGIDADYAGATTTSVIVCQPVYSSGIGLPSVWSEKGSVTGRVTISVNGTVGIGGAYIALIDATTGKEYYNTTSDAYGNYQITGINATYSSVLQAGPDGTAGTYLNGMTAYKIYAKKMPYGEGYSKAFGIDADKPSATTTAVVIVSKPAKIEMIAEDHTIVANGSDHTTVSAYVYDALGNPIADGYQIIFHMGTDKKGMGQFAVAGSDAPEGSADIIATTTNGYASAEFGWMSKAKKSNTITASWSENPSINGTLNIYSTHN